jgi:hypothetical protein
MMRLAVAGGLWGGESPNYVAPVFHGSTKNKSHRRASYRILAMSGISVIHTLSIRHHPYHTDGKVSLKTSQPTASPATPTPTSPTPPTTPTKPRISRIRTNYCGTRTPTSFRPRPSPLFTRPRYPGTSRPHPRRSQSPRADAAAPVSAREQHLVSQNRSPPTSAPPAMVRTLELPHILDIALRTY